MAAADIIYADADGTALLWDDRALVQIRRQRLLPEHLHALVARLTTAIDGRQPHYGAFMLLEENAPVLTDDVRRLQRETMLGLMRRRDVSSAVVVLGEGVTTSMQRTLVRMFSIGAPALKVFDNVDDAIAWLEAELRRRNVAFDTSRFARDLAAARAG